MSRTMPPNVISSTPDGEIHEPPLGVFVLTEFVFCRRAGICALETGREENDDSAPLSFFSFNPLYTRAEIEASLHQAVNEAIGYFVGVGISAVLAVALSYFVNKLVGVAGMFLVAWFLIFTLQRWIHALQLDWQRREALSGQDKEPDQDLPAEQDVNWWDLLQAGFESHPVQDPLFDSELNFSGKPFRYLRRKNEVIPVWRMPHYDGRLHPQNYIRMAAYCHLVERSCGASCPYGVILFGSGFDGVAVPFTPQRRKDFLEALRSARTRIARVKEGDEPAAPESSLCARCPYGKPVEYVPGETENICNGEPLQVNRVEDRQGRSFHSLCGDRFHWFPPHEDAKRMALKSVKN